MLKNKTFISEDLFYWLRLYRSENITNNIFWQLIKRYGTAKAAIEALPGIAKYYNKSRAIVIASEKDIEKELNKAEDLAVKILTEQDESYPKLLKYISFPPPILSVRGNVKILNKPAIAIVGTRRASNIGMQTAAIYAQDLGKAGFNIVSGMAKGIDTIAHRASINTGTTAVLAGGLTHIYPLENQKLYYEILDNDGAIVSDRPIGYIANARDFPRRNKIIAALSLAMLVVEAQLKSGTMISARLANEYNREVFVVPYHPLSESGEGNNSLLLDGATMTLEPHDIITSLVPLSKHYKTFEDGNYTYQGQLMIQEDMIEALIPVSVKLQNNKTESKDIESNITQEIRNDILTQIGYSPISAETLHKITEIDRNIIEAVLIELEITGNIKRCKDGKVLLQLPCFD